MSSNIAKRKKFEDVNANNNPSFLTVSELGKQRKMYAHFNGSSISFDC